MRLHRSLFLVVLLTLLAGTARANGFDDFVPALLHFNGADASTTFVDATGRTWTPEGNAQIDTAQSVFGGASGWMNGGYISTADDPAWQLDGGSSDGEWTIDLRLRFDAIEADAVVWLVTQYVDADNMWGVYWAESTDRMGFTIYEGGSQIMDMARTWAPTEDTWAHVAVVHTTGGGFIFYVDGGGASGTDETVIPDLGGDLYIGGCPDCDANAIWIDELRISTGVARWTGVFTPSSWEYTRPMPAASFPSVIRYGDLGELVALLGIALVLIVAVISWLVITVMDRRK